jgi:hypothetical protein
MRLLETANERCAGRDNGTHHRGGRLVTYPPPSTGTNYNLVDKVEHDLGDRLIWYIIHSPDGSFTYDYSIRARADAGNAVRNPNVEIFLSRDGENASNASLRLKRLETGVTIRS